VFAGNGFGSYSRSQESGVRSQELRVRSKKEGGRKRKKNYVELDSL
jgi:hypothetical protein